MTAWRLYQDAHAPCQRRANLRQGTGEGFLSLSLSLSMDCSLLPQLIFSLNKKNEMRVNRKCVSEIYHLSDICLFFFSVSCRRLPGEERELVHPAEDETWGPLSRPGTAAGGDGTGLLKLPDTPCATVSPPLPPTSILHQAWAPARLSATRFAAWL